jgi:hypothetical protein
MNETLVFKTSAAALAERRGLLKQLRLGLSLALCLLCAALSKAPGGVQALAWGLSGLLIWGFWKLDGEGLIAPFAGRELRIQDNALEIVQGRFTRLLFFSQIEQLRMIQAKDESVLALELETLDGGVRLEGYEGMAALFTALNTRKPPKVLLEVEERGFDFKSLAFLHKAVLAGGALLLPLLWIASPSDLSLKRLSGLLLIFLALFVAVFQPFSHGKGKKAAGAEIGIGAVFVLFGILFLS